MKKFDFFKKLNSKLFKLSFIKIIFEIKIRDNIMLEYHEHKKLYMLEFIIMCDDFNFTQSWVNFCLMSNILDYDTVVLGYNYHLLVWIKIEFTLF